MRYLFILPFLALGACQTTEQLPPTVQVVQVPVLKPYPKPPVIKRPVLQSNKLSGNESSQTIVKAYANDVDSLVVYSEKLDTALDVYRK